MTNYFILIKRKGSKKFTGVIPAKKGISKDKLLKTARKQIRKNFTFKIITEKDIKKILLLKKRKMLLKK